MLWCDARGTFAFVFAAVASWVCRVAHLLRIDKGGGRGLNRASGQKLSWSRLLVRARLALPVDRQFASQVYTAVDSSVAVPLCSSCKRVTCLAFIDINVVVCRSPADLCRCATVSLRFVLSVDTRAGLGSSIVAIYDQIKCDAAQEKLCVTSEASQTHSEWRVETGFLFGLKWLRLFEVTSSHSLCLRMQLWMIGRFENDLILGQLPSGQLPTNFS